MDRGLCVVLTIVTGVALGLVEACSGAGDDSHPPVANDYGTLVAPGSAGGGAARVSARAGTARSAAAERLAQAAASPTAARDVMRMMRDASVSSGLRATRSVHLIDPAEDVVAVLRDLDLVLEDGLDGA